MVMLQAVYVCVSAGIIAVIRTDICVVMWSRC